MSPIKWRMLDLLLTDAIDTAPPGAGELIAFFMAREAARDKIDSKKIPHKPHLQRKMQSG